MPEGLPSLRSVQNILSSEYCPIREGNFRFQELLQHLNSYSAPKLVSIGEDATRLISRIDYDNETDQLVGFVLPCDNDLPVIDTYLAVPFDSKNHLVKEKLPSMHLSIWPNHFVRMSLNFA